MHWLIRRDRFGPHFHLLNYFSSFIWGWLRPERIPSVTAAGISISIVGEKQFLKMFERNPRYPPLRRLSFPSCAVTERWTNHCLSAPVLPLSPPSLSLSLLSCCFSNVVVSQVPCRSRTARRLTRGSTSAWPLTWKACAIRPPLTFTCEVGSNPSPESGPK